MNTALLILAALGSIGGIVAGAYYGVRLREWLREQGPVTVTVLSIGEGVCPDRERMMLHLDLRFHNPKATACSITHAVLSQQAGGLVLKPVSDVRLGESWYSGQMPIELPPKRYTEIELGYAIKKAATHEGAEWVQHSLHIDLDDGSHIVSRASLLNYPIDYAKILQ